MLDIQLLRTNLASVAERLATRGVTLDTAAFEALEAERKALQTRTQDLQAKRNSAVQADRHAQGQGRGRLRGDGRSGRHRRRAEGATKTRWRSCRRASTPSSR